MFALVVSPIRQWATLMTRTGGVMWRRVNIIIETKQLRIQVKSFSPPKLFFFSRTSTRAKKNFCVHEKKRVWASLSIYLEKHFFDDTFAFFFSPPRCTFLMTQFVLIVQFKKVAKIVRAAILIFSFSSDGRRAEQKLQISSRSQKFNTRWFPTR